MRNTYTVYKVDKETKEISLLTMANSEEDALRICEHWQWKYEDCYGDYRLNYREATEEERLRQAIEEIYDALSCILIEFEDNHGDASTFHEDVNALHCDIFNDYMKRD